MPDAQKILQHAFGFIPSVAVCTALELEVFTHIHAGLRTPAALAIACQAHEMALRRLLYTLSALDLVEQRGDEFHLNLDSEVFLVKSSPAYTGGTILHQVKELQSWSRFGEAVRTGTTPLGAVEGDEDNGKSFAGLVGSFFNMNWLAAQQIAEELPSCRTALDVGCGSAVWSLALAKKYPQLRVTAVDGAAVLEVAAGFATRLECLDRYTLREGNFRDVALEPGHYDVAFLGQILHSEGAAASRILLRRIYECLKPGGVLVIAEMVATLPRSEQLFPNLFDLNMLMWTEKGQVFNAPELEGMCQEAGFESHRWVNAPSPSPLLLAYKG